MTPKTQTRTAPKAASTNNATPALAVAAVTPAPRQGRKGAPAFPADAVAQLADAIKTGWQGDGQVYETRQKANLRVTRLKRALIHFKHYKEPKEIKSRVWETDDGKFLLAMIDTAKASE